MDIKSTALLKYLKSRDDGQYSAKVLEIREILQDWLSYIPQTFPHYTRHTVGHSDSIVRALSSLLFREGTHRKPSLKLSAVEGYILAAAAYLHDAGMVCSDTERLELLQSEE